MYSFRTSTLIVMTLGFLFASLANLSFYAWIVDKDWALVTGFPIGWLSGCVGYMGTFFHEIGHTLTQWFYGYVAVPAFDFKHGGGFSMPLSEQQIPILILIWATMIYGLWLCREHRRAQFGLIALALLNIALAFNQYHLILCLFMGVAAECLMGSFFLYRAIFDLAPRGSVERFLNAFFGFGLIFRIFIQAYSLLNDKVYRIFYYQQKGAHGHGDLDRIADQISFLNFQDIVWILVAFNMICLITPFLLYTKESLNSDDDY